MATVSENIATITAKAAELDVLVAQFHAARSIIEAAETAIRKAQPNAGHDAHGGRIRISHYAYTLMAASSLEGRKTVAALATDAWDGVS